MMAARVLAQICNGAKVLLSMVVFAISQMMATVHFVADRVAQDRAVCAMLSDRVSARKTAQLHNGAKTLMSMAFQAISILVRRAYSAFDILTKCAIVAQRCLTSCLGPTAPTMGFTGHKGSETHTKGELVHTPLSDSLSLCLT